MIASITMEAQPSSTNLRQPSYRKILAQVLFFIALPLLIEFGAYLFQPDIFPAYLPFTTNLRNFSIGFVLISLFLITASILSAFLFRAIRLSIHSVAPSAFFFLFLTLTLNRLLPRESGFSVPRLIVFVVGLLTAAGFYILIQKQKLSTVRLALATNFYCAIAASLLLFLFQFPLHHWLAAFFIHVGIFTALLFVPWKFILAAIIFLLVFHSNQRTPLSRFAPPEKLASYDRVIFIGIDAFSPDVISNLIDANRLPEMERISKSGTFGRLHTLRVPYSPLIWNSIYTGAKPAEHGVMSFTSTAFPGSTPFLSLWLDHWSNSDWNHKLVQAMKKLGMIKILSPARSQHRLQPAIWNLVDQNNADSLVVGGWTTYPPEKIKGTFISDYAFIANPESDGTYYPPEQESKELLKWKPEVSRWPQNIQRYVARDERVHHVSIELMKKLPATTRFVFVYYSSVDAFGHHLGTYIDRHTTSDHRRKELTSWRDQIYQMMDGYIQDYRNFVDDRTLLVICSDHGFHYDKRQHNYPVDGTLLMLGKNVRNLRIEGSIYDIAPTITYALGISGSKIFHGLPLKQAFSGIIPELPARQYLRARNYYEVIQENGLEQEKLEELEDLQYINR